AEAVVVIAGDVRVERARAHVLAAVVGRKLVVDVAHEAVARDVEEALAGGRHPRPQRLQEAHAVFLGVGDVVARRAAGVLGLAAGVELAAAAAGDVDVVAAGGRRRRIGRRVARRHRAQAHDPGRAGDGVERVAGARMGRRARGVGERGAVEPEELAGGAAIARRRRGDVDAGAGAYVRGGGGAI